MSRSGASRYLPFSCLPANCVLPFSQSGHLHRNYSPVLLGEATRLEFGSDISQISARYRPSLLLCLDLLLLVAGGHLKTPITPKALGPDVQ